MKTCGACFETIEDDGGISCSCGTDCCRDCMQRWILVDEEKEPGCIGCRRVYSQDQILSVMDKAFSRPYSEWRSRFLFQKELAYMADDMEDAGRERQRREVQLDINKLLARKKQVMRVKKNRHLCGDINAELARARERIAPLRRAAGRAGGGTAPSKKVLIQPCITSGCRGFIALPGYRCSMCNKSICERCHQDATNHEKCEPEHIESATMIMRDTKACPRCAVRIFKISGCDQMWCVQCHCTFLWSSGRPVAHDSAVHNPHYFEWLFRNDVHGGGGGAAVDNNGECGGNAFYERLFLALRRLDMDNYQCKQRVYEFIRCIIHVENVILPRYQTDHRSNKDIRIAYLLGDMDRERIQSLMYKRERRFLKRDALFQIMVIGSEAWKNSVFRFITEDQDETRLIADVNHTAEYVNETIDSILSRHGGAFRDGDFLSRVTRMISSN